MSKITEFVVNKGLSVFYVISLIIDFKTYAVQNLEFLVGFKCTGWSCPLLAFKMPQYLCIFLSRISWLDFLAGFLAWIQMH